MGRPVRGGLRHRARRPAIRGCDLLPHHQRLHPGNTLRSRAYRCLGADHAGDRHRIQSTARRPYRRHRFPRLYTACQWLRIAERRASGGRHVRRFGGPGGERECVAILAHLRRLRAHCSERQSGELPARPGDPAGPLLHRSCGTALRDRCPIQSCADRNHGWCIQRPRRFRRPVRPRRGRHRHPRGEVRGKRSAGRCGRPGRR